MKNSGFSATRREAWHAANVICGYTLDQCQGRGGSGVTGRSERRQGMGGEHRRCSELYVG